MGRGRATSGLLGSLSRGDAVFFGAVEAAPSPSPSWHSGRHSLALRRRYTYTRHHSPPLFARQNGEGRCRARHRSTPQPDRSMAAAAVDRVGATWAPPAGPGGRCICLARRPPGAGGPACLRGSPLRALPCVPLPALFSPLFCLLSTHYSLSIPGTCFAPAALHSSSLHPTSIWSFICCCG